MAPKWLKVPQKSIFSGLRPEPHQGFAPGPHWGGGGGGAYSAPPQTPQVLFTSYARLQRAARVA